MDFIMSNTMPTTVRSATPEPPRPHPTRTASREPVGYKLFPAVPQTQETSPVTIQKRASLRAQPKHGRRSFSVDESRRVETSNSVSNLLAASLLRKSPSPRLDRNAALITACASPQKTAPVTIADQQHPRPMPFKVRSHRPRASLDSNSHGRSASIPLFLRERNKPQPSKPGATTTTLFKGVPKPNPGSLIDAERKTRARELERARQRAFEKPLPLPPSEPKPVARADSPLEGSRTNALSPTGSETTPCSISALNLLSDQDRHHPLSEDTKVRELMGMAARGKVTADTSSIGSMHVNPGSTRAASPVVTTPKSGNSLASSSGFSTPGTVLSETFEMNSLRKMTITRKAVPQKIQHKTSEVTLRALPVPATDLLATSPRHMEEPNLTPAALKVGVAPTPSTTCNSPTIGTIIAQTPPAVLAMASMTNARIAAAVESLQALSEQTITIYARYDCLRVERRDLSNTMSACLEQGQSSPAYVNVLLDQQMSLGMVCASMDVCIAGLKALEKKRSVAIAQLAGCVATLGPFVSKPQNPHAERIVGTSSAFSTLESSPETEGGAAKVTGPRKRAVSDVSRQSTGLNIRVSPGQCEYPQLVQSRVTNVKEGLDSPAVSMRRTDRKIVTSTNVSHKVGQSVSGSIFTAEVRQENPAARDLRSGHPHSPPPDRPLPATPTPPTPVPKAQKPVIATADIKIYSPNTYDAGEYDFIEEERELGSSDDFSSRWKDVRSQCSSIKSMQTVHVYFAPDPMPYPLPNGGNFSAGNPCETA